MKNNCASVNSANLDAVRTIHYPQSNYRAQVSEWTACSILLTIDSTIHNIGRLLENAVTCI